MRLMRTAEFMVDLAACVVFGDDNVGQSGVFALHDSGAHRFLARCDSLSALQTCLESIL